MGRRATVLGIDPGLKGFIVQLAASRELLGAWPMPTIKVSRGNRINAAELGKLLRGLSPRGVLIEKQWSRPGDSKGGGFKTGEGYGTIIGALAALEIPYREEAPQAWKRRAGLPKTDDAKAAAIEAAGQRFPSVDLRASSKCRKAHDGKAEALLMAERALGLFGLGAAGSSR